MTVDDPLQQARDAIAKSPEGDLPVRAIALGLVAIADELRKQRAAIEKGNDRREALISLIKANQQPPSPALVTTNRLNMVPPGTPGASQTAPGPAPAAEPTKTGPSVAGDAMLPNRPSPPVGPSMSAGQQPTTRPVAPTGPAAAGGNPSQSSSATGAGPGPGLQKGTCRGCGVAIWWGKTRNRQGVERPHPFNADGSSHFATCPQADTFRGGR